MKKALLATLSLGLFATASADSFGIRGSFFNGFYGGNNSNGTFGIGLQYSYSMDALSTLRAGIDLYPNMYGSNVMGFGGEVAYLMKLPGLLSTNNDMNVYVGGGVGLMSASSDGATSFAINPTVLGGVNFYVTPEFGAFVELGTGYSFVNTSYPGGSASASGFFIQPRFGITYSLR